jgi:mono/diheme cytochrome c family protein
MLVVVFGCSLLAACEQQEMTNQPKLKPYSETDAFGSAGAAARHPAPGSVPRNADLETRPDRIPVPITRALLERGKERFTVYCAPCHGALGDGNGSIVQRGFPAPPSYHSARLRDAPERHFYDVITDGYGVMYSYAGRVAPADRWAIVAYIGALQLSQHATPADVPEAHRADLEDAGAAGAPSP